MMARGIDEKDERNLKFRSGKMPGTAKRTGTKMNGLSR